MKRTLIPFSSLAPFAIAAILTISPLASAATYKWVSADGSTHYTNDAVEAKRVGATQIGMPSGPVSSGSGFATPTASSDDSGPVAQSSEKPIASEQETGVTAVGPLTFARDLSGATLAQLTVRNDKSVPITNVRMKISVQKKDGNWSVWEYPTYANGAPIQPGKTGMIEGPVSADEAEIVDSVYSVSFDYNEEIKGSVDQAPPEGFKREIRQKDGPPPGWKPPEGEKPVPTNPGPVSQ